MADYYATWSTSLLLQPEEFEWLKQLFAALVNYVNASSENQSVLSDKIEADFGVQVHLVFEDHDHIEFEYQFYTNDDSPTLVMCSDYGNALKAAEIIRAFLNRWRPDDAADITWAETCSKLRPGDFAGGALFITARGVEGFHTSDWLKEKYKKHERRITKKKTKKGNKGEE